MVSRAGEIVIVSFGNDLQHGPVGCGTLGKKHLSSCFMVLLWGREWREVLLLLVVVVVVVVCGGCCWGFFGGSWLFCLFVFVVVVF